MLYLILAVLAAIQSASSQSVINGSRQIVGGGLDAGKAIYTRVMTGVGAPASSLCNTAKTITAATAASPPVLISTAHAFNSGDIVVIYGTVVGGMTGLTGIFVVGSVTTNTFALCGAWDGTNCQSPPTTSGTYSSGAFASNQVGREYFRQDTTAGQNKYYCADSTGSPAWAQQSGVHVITFSIDNGASVISTGELLGYNPTADFACTINRIDITGYPSGSATVDVWKHAAGTIPAVGDKISASAPLTLSSSRLNQNGSLTGWTTAVAIGDVFGFSVASATNVTKLLGQIWCQ